MERNESATEARVRFGELMRRVTDKDETVIVERDGVPQVVILSIDSYRLLRGGETPLAKWTANLRLFHERLRAELGGRRLPSSVETIRQMREERDEHLASLR